MILAAYLVTGFLVASVYAVGMLRGRRDRHHRLGLLIPLTVGLRSWPRSSSSSATPPRARSPSTSRSSSRRWSASRRPHRDVTEYIGGICTDDGVKCGIGIPGLDSFLVGFSTDTEVIGLDSVPPTTSARRRTRCCTSPSTRWSGSAPAMIFLGALARDRLVAKARHPADAVVPARRRGLRGRRDHRDGGGLDRHRGRAPAVDRPGRSCAPRRRSPAPSGVWLTFSIVLVLYTALGVATMHRAAPDGAALARGGRRRGRGPLRPARRSRHRRRREAPMSKADAAAAILWVGATLYAVFGGADFGAGFWSLAGGRGERGDRARRLIDWAIGPGLGGQPRLADLHPRRPLDRVLGRLRGGDVDAVHPALPGGARDRPARRRASPSTRSSKRPSGAQPRRAPVRGLLGDHARSSWARWSARSPPAGCRSATPRAIRGRAGSTRSRCWSASCSSPPAPTSRRSS